MPSWVSGKDGEKAWKKAVGIVSDEYGASLKKSDSDRFYSLVTTVYKKVCSSPDYECGIGEGVAPVGKRLAALNEELSKFCEAISASKLHLAKQTLGWHRQDANYLRRLAKEKDAEQAKQLKKAADMHDAAGDVYEVVLKTKTAADLRKAKKARLDALTFTRDHT